MSTDCRKLTGSILGRRVIIGGLTGDRPYVQSFDEMSPDPLAIERAYIGSTPAQRATMLYIAWCFSCVRSYPLSCMNFNHTDISAEKFASIIASETAPSVEDLTSICSCVKLGKNELGMAEKEFEEVKVVADSLVEIALTIAGATPSEHKPYICVSRNMDGSIFCVDASRGVPASTQYLPTVFVEPLRINASAGYPRSKGFEYQSIIYPGHGIAIAGFDSSYMSAQTVLDAAKKYAQWREVPVSNIILLDFYTNQVVTINTEDDVFYVDSPYESFLGQDVIDPSIIEHANEDGIPCDGSPVFTAD